MRTFGTTLRIAFSGGSVSVKRFPKAIEEDPLGANLWQKSLRTPGPIERSESGHRDLKVTRLVQQLKTR
jgi:hypothetical protein